MLVPHILAPPVVDDFRASCLAVLAVLSFGKSISLLPLLRPSPLQHASETDIDADLETRSRLRLGGGLGARVPMMVGGG